MLNNPVQIEILTISTLAYKMYEQVRVPVRRIKKMEQEYIQKIYTVEDIDKAFSMDLETAVFVLENSIGMSNENQRVLIESMKKIINQN